LADIELSLSISARDRSIDGLLLAPHHQEEEKQPAADEPNHGQGYDGRTRIVSGKAEDSSGHYKS
jgi:hypothetical protein